MLQNINNLPETARTWVYQSNRRLTPDEAKTAKNELQVFIDQWTSHKIGVAGSGHLLYDRFIILMADEDAVKVGGCSIDSSVRFIKEIQRKLNTDFFDRLCVAYKLGQEVQSASQADFQKLVESGKVSDETIVFNNLVQTKKEFLTRWEIPFGDSWHKNLSASHTPFNSVL